MGLCAQQVEPIVEIFSVHHASCPVHHPILTTKGKLQETMTIYNTSWYDKFACYDKFHHDQISVFSIPSMSQGRQQRIYVVSIFIMNT